MGPGEFIAAVSSNIEGYRYDDGVLTVRFRNGRTYAYAGVPEQVYEGFHNAPSKGAYLHRHIKQRYVGTEI
ncbi:MAG TPA: KTSC domain-containing protein [Candidatus Cybelea sp.]|nr:KTSC domain-containing protein [Candidatus Cybelea sp.]